MEDAPPQLGNIPQHSEMSIPTLSSQSQDTGTRTGANGNASFQNAKDSMMNNAQSAMNTAKNHPLTQNVVDTVSNGDVSPIAETVKDQHAKTTAEFRNLADSRAPPSQRAATGQHLTHYHSLFYNLLSWENPRATAISYSLLVASIFAGRYLPLLRWTFKALYISLGLISATELVGKLTVNQGIVSSFRPRKYFTIPRQSLENMLGDVEQLINFFVIEFQRIMLAENLAKTVAAFSAALVSYFLIKFLPLWGLSLIAVTTMFFAPLIYNNNKELIDQQLRNLSDVINRQAHQVKGLAEHHTARATETVKAYAGDYSAKAQNYMNAGKQQAQQQAQQAKDSTVRATETAKDKAGDYSAKAQDYMGSAKQQTQQQAQQAKDSTVRATETARDYAGDYSAKAQDYMGTAKQQAQQAKDSAVNQGARATDTAKDYAGDYTGRAQNYMGGATQGNDSTGYSQPSYSSSDFPHAPKQEPTPGVTSHEEQYAQSQFGGQADAMPSQYGSGAAGMPSVYDEQSAARPSQYGGQVPSSMQSY